MTVDETCVDSNITFKKCCKGNSTTGIHVDNNSKNQLIVVHAFDGFIPGAASTVIKESFPLCV